jgi:hypothetical protein
MSLAVTIDLTTEGFLAMLTKYRAQSPPSLMAYFGDNFLKEVTCVECIVHSELRNCLGTQNAAKRVFILNKSSL